MGDCTKIKIGASPFSMFILEMKYINLGEDYGLDICSKGNIDLH